MNLRRLTRNALICCVAMATYSALSQAPQDRSQDNRPQTRPAQNGSQARPQQPNGGNRPAPGAGNRPNPGAGNRPNPGGANRPNPGAGNRPGPGAGNVRPPVRPVRPNPGGSRPPVRPGRPAQWGRPPQNRPSYNFRPNDRDSLRRYYQSRFRSINRSRRPVFSIGGFFPYASIQYLSPLPASLYGTLPPPPPGYAMGYYDGYVIVYDPVSYVIVNVIDLLQ